MSTVILSILVVLLLLLLLALLFVRRAKIALAVAASEPLTDAPTAPRWDSPSTTPAEAVPCQPCAVTVAVPPVVTRTSPSVGQIAVGVWLGLWLFVATASLASGVVAFLILGSFSAADR